jgi:hypothetical protein
VEGDDDCKIYPKFFQQGKCSVEQVHGGCSQLEIAIEKLQQYANRIIGIRDADFCHITQSYAQYDNLFYTDYHDIEMTMLYNDTVFENILYEYSLQTESAQIKQNILLESSFVGYIRYYNEVNNCSINFSGFTFGNAVNLSNNNLHLQKSLCMQDLNQRSPNKTIAIDETVMKPFISLNPIGELYQLVNGHDFIKLLALRINFQITRGITDKDVSKSLRNSYRIDDFKRTKLYNDLLRWQKANNHDILIP